MEVERSEQAPHLKAEYQPIPRRFGASPDTVLTMAERKKVWKPATVGEAREYLDAHERDGDPAIVEACEALIDVIENRSGPSKQSNGPNDTFPVPKPPLDQLEEEGDRLNESGINRPCRGQRLRRSVRVSFTGIDPLTPTGYPAIPVVMTAHVRN